ncbi:hypothetical protein MKK63_11140 [Methylobacterium sp. J-088]|uniref:hypothetical protein n=1 Tax=Methylobacterium sp. J-088 TaxID=2836664 RepID=UPI001FBB7374|nr:hypothetical protein [Methylobacterium sp. J-088]MCJ2063265.1 hypothetical protein [Methylobacterium sp. J-088]
MTHRFGLALDVLSAIAAACAAAFWWLSAAVPVPTEIILTADGGGWQPITNAMRDQGTWGSYGAAGAAVAAGLQAVAIIARRAVRN